MSTSRIYWPWTPGYDYSNHEYGTSMVESHLSTRYDEKKNKRKEKECEKKEKEEEEEEEEEDNNYL